MCSRCGGSGYIHKWRHIEGGVCFKCRGKVSVANTRTERMELLRERNRIKEQQRKESLQKTLDSFSHLPF